MALARTTLRASLASYTEPGACRGQAKQLLCADAGSGKFVALFDVGLRPGSCRLVCVNAGHNPPLWYQARCGKLRFLD